MKLPWPQKQSQDPELAQAKPESKEAVIAEVIRSAEAHIERLLVVRQEHPIDAADILSPVSASGSAKDIVGFLKSNVNLAAADSLRRQATGMFKPGTNVVDELKKETQTLHQRMKSLIEEVARLLENKQYTPLESRLAGSKLSAKERESASRLIDAHKQSNMSIRALRMTVEVFTSFNRRIIERLNDGNVDKKQEKDLILSNAILVYEISNFLIQYVENFKVWGLEEICKLQSEVNKRFDEQAKVEQQLRLDAERQADEQTKVRTLEQVASREQHARKIRQEWDAFVEEIQGLEGVKDRLEQRLATLRVIRDNAKNQITFVDLLTMTATVKDAITCLDATVVDVEGLELVPITEDRVERLLSLTV
ncbi:MAG: hypothetical protein K2X93_06895 [Candidatus Obscuribacterales bacterium]|nr:hypothetical protein [Candidatus Obscuribacterales bacterium]